MGVPCFSVENNDSAKKYINNLISEKTGGYSVAINAEKIMMYNQNEQMKNIIDESILPIPDGSGAILGFKFLNKLNSIKLNLPQIIYEISAEKGHRLFLFGGSEDVNSKAVSNLREKFPQINIVGNRNGYNISDEDIVLEISRSNPEIVMIALGSPKQEILAKKLLESFPHTLFIGCGGALDIISGKVKRAPLFFQNNHLEWFYRLASNPKRIKRQKVLLLFMMKIIKEGIINKKKL